MDSQWGRALCRSSSGCGSESYVDFFFVAGESVRWGACGRLSLRFTCELAEDVPMDLSAGTPVGVCLWDSSWTFQVESAAGAPAGVCLWDSLVNRSSVPMRLSAGMLNRVCLWGHCERSKCICPLGCLTASVSEITCEQGTFEFRWICPLGRLRASVSEICRERSKKSVRWGTCGCLSLRFLVNRPADLSLR
jgi:hypothetical protein